MCDNLAERCAREVDAQLAKLVDNHRRGLIAVSTPIYRGLIPVDEIQKLARLNRAGLFARAWFGRHGPAWAQPLPLNDLERIGCFISDIAPLHLVAFYSYSLQGRDFDFRDHPMLYEHARGVMASPHTLNDLRGDLDLLAEFPPKQLPGLDERHRWCLLENRASKLLEGGPIPGGFPQPPSLAVR